VFQRLQLPLAVVLLVAGGTTLVLPSFSTLRPQHANYQLIQNLDIDKAWLQYLSFYALPEGLQDVRRFDHEGVIYPWGDKTVGDLSIASPTGLDSPMIKLDVIEDVQNRLVKVNLKSRRGAIWMGLVIPQDSLLKRYEIDGIRYPIEPAFWADWQDNYLLEFRGIQNKEVSVDLYFSSSDDVKAYVYDVTHELPASYRSELEARNESSVKAHDGDRYIAFREVTL
jgi:hypothetical protein